MPVKNSKGRLADYAEQKPIAITPDGTLVLPAEIKDKAGAPAFSLGTLEAPLQKTLTLARIKPDPRYNLGIFGHGLFTKDEIVGHVERMTEIGQMVVQAEVNYCAEFLAEHGPAPKAAKLPKSLFTPVELPPWKAHAKRLKLAVKNTALFCENTTDPVTQKAAHWRIANVHPVFAQEGFKVVCLKDQQDVRQEFQTEARKSFVVYIAGVGHGSPTVYTGHLSEHLLEVGLYDPAEVKPKVIHLLSCQTAQTLGKDVVTQGARAYAGYYKNFMFVWDVPATGVNEETLFWNADATFDLYLARGYTVEQAHTAVIAAFNAARSAPGVPNSTAATYLTWDRDWYRTPVIDAAYGDKAATIAPVSWVWITIPLVVQPVPLEAELAIPASGRK